MLNFISFILKLSHLFNVKISLNFTYITPYFPTLSTPNFHQKFTIFTPNFETPIYTIVAPTSLKDGFSGLSKVTTLTFDNFDTSETTSMYGTFSKCTSLRTITFGDYWNTSNVTTTRSMFNGDKSLTTINGLDKFKTGKVETMAWMFQDCSSLTSLSLTSFNTESVKNFSANGDNNGFSGMFSGCTKLQSLNMSSFVITSSGKNLPSLWKGCTSLKDLWTPKVQTSSISTWSTMYTDLYDKSNPSDKTNYKNKQNNSAFHMKTVSHHLTNVPN